MASIANILKIKKAFSVLPNKKIIKIYNVVLAKLVNKGEKIQITTKGLSRKQTIIPLLDKHIETIMRDAGTHTNLINGLLKNIK